MEKVDMSQNIDLVILSSFDWSMPGTPELISETARYAGINAIHFTKPRSIFRYRREGFNKRDNIETRNLKIFSARLSKLPLFNKLQNKFVVSQIKNAILDYSAFQKKPTLIYTNMECIVGILPSIRKRFETLLYICADYSEINPAFDLNARFADKIMTIPRSMFTAIEAKYPGKPFLWPQMTSTIEDKSDLSRQTIETLKEIPRPRVVYSGSAYPRTDKNLYEKISDALPEVSFISFGTENGCRRDKNRHTIPWLEKRELFAFLENCDIGFMPYDIRNPHNLHCVPLKLFEYFSLGLPVVSTALLNIQEFQPHVQIASNANEFVHIIRNLLRQNQNRQAIEKRKGIAQRHSTQNMQGKLLDLLGCKDSE
jgi:glycosyltransferase involved in cell wall biosynthesis